MLGGVPAVRSGEPATGRGGVDDVVVNQGAGLVELERRSEADGGGARHEPAPLLGRRAQREPDGAEHRPHPLARGHEGLGGVEQVLAGGGQVGPLGPAGVQHLSEPGVDGGAHSTERGGKSTHANQRNGAEPGRVAAAPGPRCGGRRE